MEQGELDQAYRTAISRFATGVTVIATRASDGLVGMTASAVTSLSLNPLQLLVCVANHLPTCTAIKESGRFAVNVLGREDKHIALHFATRQRDKFAAVPYRERRGLPLLDGAIAHFVCDVAEAVRGGDHTIFVADVRYCHSQGDRQPLVYFDRAFGTLCDSGRPGSAPVDEQLRSNDELVLMW